MTVGQIPQSQALAEASSSDSMAELMNRQPPFSDADLDKLIGAMRAQRQRWVESEAAAPSGGKAKGPKAEKASSLLQSTPKSAEDLGL